MEEEHNKIKDWIKVQEDHDIVVDAITKHFVKLTLYSGSRHGACLQVEITFPEAIFTLRSKTMKKKLLEYLDSMVNTKTEEIESVLVRIQKLCNEMTRNLFIPCMSEVRKIRNLILKRNDEKNNIKCKMKADKTTGAIKLIVEREKYKVSIETTIPTFYPDALTFNLTSSSFPYSILYRYTNIANDISRRCALGWPPEESLKSAIGQGQGPEGLDNDEKTKKKKKGEKADVLIKSADIHKFKNDMRFLKKTKELRGVNNARKKGNAKEHAESSTTRRFARKQLKKLNRKEVTVERELIAKQEREAALAEALLQGLHINEGPTPSLSVVFEYLIDSFALNLPVANCPCCEKRLLVANPSDLMIMFGEGTEEEMKKKKTKKKKKEKSKKPIRLYCGHWFHYSCLDTALTSPPFKKPCPVCGKRMYHKSWPSDVKKLEKRWANEQAKKREIGEIATLLGFGLDDEFTVKGDENATIVRDKNSAYDRMF